MSVMIPGSHSPEEIKQKPFDLIKKFEALDPNLGSIRGESGGPGEGQVEQQVLRLELQAPPFGHAERRIDRPPRQVGPHGRAVDRSVPAR